MLNLLRNSLKMELLGVLLSKQAAVAHVFEAFDEVFEAHAALSFLEQALDVKSVAMGP